jgi:cell wall-associated NlpC family hydrolase
VNFRPARIITAVAFALALALLSPSYALGQPSNDIQAKAAQLENDLNATNAQVATLGQQLTAAQARVDEADAKIADAEGRMNGGQDEINRLKGLINERAASIYKVAGASSPFDAFNAKDAKDVTARSKYSDLAAQHDNALIDELAAAKRQLATEKDAAVTARSEATDQRDAAAVAKAHADAAASEQQRLLDQVNGEIEQALRALTAAKAEQALRAQAAAAAPAPKAGAGGGSPLGSGGAGAAVAYAQAQVGKPYCNTNPERFGPTCYDCSGLTYMAWRAGGLTIPLTSGPQGAAYPHVDLGSLQPGDLITTSSWSAHVGIWVGGGYVNATSYQNNPNAVKFVQGTGTVIDAVRPH